MRTTLLCYALVGLLAACTASPVQAADGMLTHDVYFTLKDKSDAAKKQLVAGCEQYLADHPGVVSFSAGVLVEGHKREVNDRDFDVALQIVFQDKASHDAYQKAEDHHKFIEAFQENWESVRVFDSLVGTPATPLAVRPIGTVKKTEESTRIVLDKKHRPGLLGLKGYSHAYVFWWFSRNDTPTKRSILQVHPMGNRENPLTGVFATRSPVRPNLIAMTLCKIVSVEGGVIEVEKIDAFDGTPVLDVKPFIPGYDSTADAKIPDWLRKARAARQAKQE